MRFSASLLVLCGIMDAGQRTWTIEELLHLPTLSDPQIRPDGDACAYVRRDLDDSHNRYRNTILIAQAPTWESVPLAEAHWTDQRPRWSPDGKTLAFVSARDGAADVYLANPVRRVTRSITGVGQYQWSADGQSIAYLAVDPPTAEEAARTKAGDDVLVADRNYKYSRIWLQPISGGPARQITKVDRHIVSFDWSRDATKFVFAAQITPRNRDTFNIDLYELNVATAGETPLVTQPGRDADPSYSPDGRWVAFHSQGGTLNYFAERHVGLVPSGGGPIRYLTKNLDADVFRGGNRFFWSPDGQEIIYLAGKSIHDNLYRQNLQSGGAQVLAESIAGAFSFSKDGAKAIFLKAAADHPADLSLWSRQSETRITLSSIDTHQRLTPRTLRWKSRDGLDVEGVLWLPFSYKQGARVPLLVELHGGPTGVVLDSFPTSRTYPTQVFLDRGYAVFAPNFRGSVNYGASFRLANIESQGFGDFDDVNTGIDKLIEQGIADPDRLGIYGWSYGGYLAAWTIGRANRFKAASIGAPATDWISYYGQSDGPRDVLWTYFGGTPWAKPESYIRHSPRSGLPHIKTPTLLQVGERDINHNAEIFQALTDLGIPVEYAVYPREGHAIVEPAHQRDLMQRNLDWFERWLRRN